MWGAGTGTWCVWMPQPVLSEILPPALPILELLTQQERLLSESWLAPATSHLSNPSFLHLSHGDKRACWKVPIKSPQHRPGASLSSHPTPATSSHHHFPASRPRLPWTLHSSPPAPQTFEHPCCEEGLGRRFTPHNEAEHPNTRSPRSTSSLSCFSHLVNSNT